MLDFHSVYHPLTSRPFLSSPCYREFLPSEALRPYIACYWAAESSGNNRDVLVIPDTCMDVIISVNYTKQAVIGRLCSIQDRPFVSSPQTAEDKVFTFAVRFHFWAAHLFLGLNFTELRNENLGLEHLGSGWKNLSADFPHLPNLTEMIRRTEQLLLKKLPGINQNNNLFQSFNRILFSRGTTTVKEICGDCSISQRQLERQFLQKVGMPMKRISNLVRYQNLWQESVMSPRFDLQDAVFRYGYVDESHLFKEFKRFHGVGPEEAKRMAYASR